MTIIELEYKADALLGEGPFWDAQQQKLYWVDIERSELHVYDPAAKRDQTIPVGQEIGAAVLRATGGLVVALKHGFYHLELNTGALTSLGDPERELPENRFNDGKCDPAGRFWAGTMHHPETRTHCGSLYSLGTDLAIRRHVEKVSVSNGLAWSLDGKTMYYIDSPTRVCVAYDYDNATGDIENRRVAVEIPEGYGWPDGMTIDCEGMLWIAMWDGWRICRFDPATGRLVEEVRMPVARPTSCAFGGVNLEVLYVTSASTRLDREALEKQPLAGAIFRAVPGVKGTPSMEFLG